MNSFSRLSFSAGDIGSLKFTENLGFIKALLEKNVWIYQASTLTQVCMNEETAHCLEKRFVEKLPSCSSAVIQFIDNHDILLPSLSVEIAFGDAGTKGRRGKREVYHCIFGSVASAGDQPRSGEERGVKLPLVCVLSGKSRHSVISPVLENTLGCIITPLTVLQPHIHWLTGISINELVRRDVETEFSVVYECRSGVTFSCNLPYGELYYLWTSCKQSNMNKLLCEELENFVNVFSTHFECGFKLKVSRFKIVKILLKDQEISIDDKVEMFSTLAPLLYCTLSFIESDLTPTFLMSQ